MVGERRSLLYGIKVICRDLGCCIWTVFKVNIVCQFTAFSFCQFKNCSDPYQYVREIMGESANTCVIGRERGVSEHQESNTKGFTFASRGVRACASKWSLPQDVFTAASIFLSNNKSDRFSLCLNSSLSSLLPQTQVQNCQHGRQQGPLLCLTPSPEASIFYQSSHFFVHVDSLPFPFLPVQLLLILHSPQISSPL